MGELWFWVLGAVIAGLILKLIWSRYMIKVLRWCKTTVFAFGRWLWSYVRYLECRSNLDDKSIEVLRFLFALGDRTRGYPGLSAWYADQKNWEQLSGGRCRITLRGCVAGVLGIKIEESTDIMNNLYRKDAIGVDEDKAKEVVGVDGIWGEWVTGFGKRILGDGVT
jgi:hypothetical protein